MFFSVEGWHRRAQVSAAVRPDQNDFDRLRCADQGGHSAARHLHHRHTGRDPAEVDQ